MSTTIFYFSGRGNSLKAARDIACKLGDAKVVPITKAMEGTPDFSSDRIGLVFPVIDLGMPAIVTTFIKKISAAHKGKYFFAAILTGGMPAATLQQTSSRFKAQGLKLSAGFLIVANGTQESLDSWPERIDEIVSVVKKKDEQKIEKASFMNRIIYTGIANRLALFLIPGEDKKFSVKESCNGCGICARVCPVKNISIKDNRPVWQHKCEQCGACFNCCPTKALHGKNLAAHTYHMNPEIETKDLFID